MTEQQFNQRLRELLRKVEQLPETQRATLLDLAEETRQRDQAIRNSAARARDALDDWRLIPKYRVFDAEARIREAQVERSRRDEDK